MKHGALPLLALAALALFPAPARADEAACRAAYVDTQRLQRSGLLRAARGAALSCGQDVCSPTVRSSCAGWLEEIERAQPTIVIDARGHGGVVLTDVRVEADGQLLAERLTGRALEVDPGESVLRFSFGDQRVEQRTLIHEGEKYRTLTVHFQDPPAAAAQDVSDRAVAPGGAATGEASAAASPPAGAATAVGALAPVAVPRTPRAASPPSDEPLAAAGVSPAVYALGGLGIAGIGTFAVLAASGYASEEHLRHTCEGSCSSRAVSSVRRRYVYADAALGVGVTSLLVLGAVWLWPSAPADRPQLDGERDEASGVSAQLQIGPTGLDVTGEF